MVGNETSRRRVGLKARRAVASPLISDKPISDLPNVPTSLHTKQLFKRGNEAINHLKYKQEVTGTR